jgi:hypothetical protein
MSSHVPKFRSLYASLGVQLTATREEIRRVYKDRAVRMHPDKVPFEQRAAATFAFQALHDAYEYCLSKVGTNYAKPTVEDEEEEGASGATNDGEEAFWCVRDDVPSEYAAAAGGTGYWKEGDSEAPAAWMNWVKACAKAERNERVKKTRFERLWLRTEYLDAYKAFEAWRQKVEDAERVESQAWEMLHAPIQTARNQRGATAHTINPQRISPNINDELCISGDVGNVDNTALAIDDGYDSGTEEKAFWTAYLEESKQNALYLNVEDDHRATPGLCKAYRPSTHRPVTAKKRLEVFMKQVVAIEARGYRCLKDARYHSTHIKERKANQRKLEAAAADEAREPERKKEERVKKRVEYLYGRAKELGPGKFDVRKHPGVRTPALFDDVDVDWREKVEIEGGVEEKGKVEGGEEEMKEVEGFVMLDDEAYFSDEGEGALVRTGEVDVEDEDDGFMVVSTEVRKDDEAVGRGRWGLGAVWGAASSLLGH